MLTRDVYTELNLAASVTLPQRQGLKVSRYDIFADIIQEEQTVEESRWLFFPSSLAASVPSELRGVRG